MPDFGSFRGFGEKLTQGQTPTQLGLIGSQEFGIIPILDTYPNAFVAYSTRRLRLAYSGSAIRVRRSSDNAESDIGFNSLYDLDSSALLSFVGSGNGFVTTWYDQSGNGNNASQTTAANQPQIVSSGALNTKNNKAIIDFDGINDFLNYSGSGLAGVKYSIFAAHLRKSTQAVSYLLGGNIGATNENMHIGWFANTTYRFAQYSNDLNATVASFTTEQLLLANALNSTTGKQIYFNNTFASSNTNTVNLNAYLNASIGRYNPGGGSVDYFFHGKASEIIIYASDKTSDLTGINTDINTYYAIY
jgi:hypothetical protein